MKLYRSIGEKEFLDLIGGKTIIGRYCCKTEPQNTCDEENVCCFFVDELLWQDTNHKFLIVVDIPQEYLSFGIGKYYASKNLRKTKTWSGRNGGENYKIREAYVSSYSLEDVKEIFLFNHFANHFVETIKNKLIKGKNISLYPSNEKPFSKTKETFKYVSGYYQTIEDLEKWLESVTPNENNFVTDTKNLLSKLDLSYEQALKIRQLLRVS